MRRCVMMFSLLAAACSGAPERAANGSGSAAPVAPAAQAADDPWNRPLPTDWVPSQAEVAALADRACPRMVAPHFYRVDAGAEPSFVLGTRHLGVGMAKLPPEVIDALKGARIAVFETHPDDDDDGPEAPAGDPLSVQLGPRLWARFRALAGADLAASLEDAPPPVALLMLTALYEDKTQMLDAQLIDAARAAGLELGGLETSASQARLLERWMDLRALKGALLALDDRAELARDTADELAEYCAGTDEQPGLDPDDRAELRAAGYTEEELTRFQRELLDDRNAAWIPQLEALFARGDAFVAVGEDHLTGPGGVVARLRARGLKVTRVLEPRR